MGSVAITISNPQKEVGQIEDRTGDPMFSSSVFYRVSNKSWGYIRQRSVDTISLPVRIYQLDSRVLDLETRGCGFDSPAGQPNKY